MGISTLERETESAVALPPDDLHLLVQLEALRDENSRSRLREAAWISIILHLIILFSIRELPKILPQKTVVLLTPEQQMKERELTFLEQPPDTQKVTTPPDTNKISDKNRIAQSKNPQLDRKTLEQLARAGREGAPGVQPTPPSPPPQMAMNQPPPQAQPQQQSPPPQQQSQSQSQSKLQPPPVAQKPSFKTGPGLSAGSAIEQAARASAQARSGGIAGEYGGGPGRANTSIRSDMEILSDTMGVDFSPYLQRVLQSVRVNWYNLIPEVARPPLLKQGNSVIEFVITKDGGVKSMRLAGPSGDVSLDRAAWGGITASNPFPPLPGEFKGEYIALRIRFMYNPDRNELR
jgi:TonB family protein